jgi:ribulose-5-phosphate 4-epimerase/fuculose-1-phosphate aldolase
VLHTHSLNGVAVSAQKGGVLPLSQQSMFILASLAYHDYEGLAVRDDEKRRLQSDLGRRNYLMLRNHGLLTLGATIADAWIAMYFFEAVCTIQVRALAGSRELTAVDPAVIATSSEQANKATGGRGAAALAWPGLLRRLDRALPGYDA